MINYLTDNLLAQSMGIFNYKVASVSSTIYVLLIRHNEHRIGRQKEKQKNETKLDLLLSGFYHKLPLTGFHCQITQHNQLCIHK